MEKIIEELKHLASEMERVNRRDCTCYSEQEVGYNQGYEDASEYWAEEVQGLIKKFKS